MLDWLFKPAPVINGCSREVHVTSSRYGTKTYTVYADRPVNSIIALKVISDNLPPLEPGESREIKTSLG